MASLIPADSMDFAAYERATEAASKVRPASAWINDVAEARAERAAGKRHPSMTSTKVGRYIEFRPGELTVWAGYSGHRKSMFTSQVALDLCAQGQRTLIASFEMLPAKTIERMVRQASGTDDFSNDFLLDFGDWTDRRLWLFDHIGRIKPALCLGVCRYFAEELKGRHVFIDSMMMVCASEEHLDEQKQFATDLVRLAKETGLHLHLVTHCRKPQGGAEDKAPTKYDVRGAAAITDQADNVLTVWDNKAKRRRMDEAPHDAIEAEKPDAIVAVEKQRDGWEGKIALFFNAPALRFHDDLHTPVRPYDMTGGAR